MFKVSNILRLVILSLLILTPQILTSKSQEAQAAPVFQSQISDIEGPFIHPPVRPFNSNISEQPLDTLDFLQPDVPLKYVPGTEPKGASTTIENWVDEVAQTEQGSGFMPLPETTFEGMSYNTNLANRLWPPDTNGDISPYNYIQSVNTSIAIFNRDGTLAETPKSFNDFFVGDNQYCDSANRGDPVVVYDRFAQRWLISDFAFPDDYGPFYECIAVSKTLTPTLQAEDWWMYAFQISESSLNDYPKVGVWRDGYYFSFNMFKLGPDGWDWDGVQVWAFKKTEILSGAEVQPISFQINPESYYTSLLPAHALDQPTVGTPAYFISVFPPDKLQIWEFSADWVTPSNSSFSGPEELTVADFAIAASVPQKDTPILLDSLSYRPMMQLVYRNLDNIEGLWMNHTVASGGVAGIRWYEILNPGDTPVLNQQGTYQPDENHRWMGSLAVDQDGNMAVGYSLSSESLYPSIYYAGRLAGETPGVLPQAEQMMVDGGGSQVVVNHRWGDYSAMAVDPVDDCTFWYTTEYYVETGREWHTRIGTFKFPTCNQPTGYLAGIVRDSITNAPIPGAALIATSDNTSFSLLADENGEYTMPLINGTYSLSAGPLNPGYPISETLTGIDVFTGFTTPQDIYLSPMPNLIESDVIIYDDLPGGNGNGFPEPGETGIELWNQLLNDGALISDQISATLTSLTAGVTVEDPFSGYPDIPAGSDGLNLLPFTISIDSNLTCGQEINFQKEVTDSLQTYTLDLSLNTGLPLARTPIFNNDVEGGSAGWTTGGTNNTWEISNENSHSPVNAWVDSPGGNYLNNTYSYLQSPIYDLNGKRQVQFDLWVKYDLEPGYDLVYIDYSLDGGGTWSENNQSLAIFNGHNDWNQVIIDASVLDNQPNVALRFRLVSDNGVSYDGIAIDDLVLSYQPFLCTYGWHLNYFPWIANE